MATTVNARDLALAATSPRITPVALPTNVSVDYAGVTGSTRPADNATVNRITRAATAPVSPAPTDGDIWVDTSTTPNIIRTRVAGAWQASASYTTNTNQITDGANLGGTAAWTGVTGATKPADNATVNRITSSASAPTSPTPVNGDIWIDTSVTPSTVKTRIGGSWVASATYVTDTAHITDGAQLGLTATWAGVTGTGKPSSYADVTTTILTASGTSIVMTNAQLFKSASGTAGVFIGAGGIFGKNSGGSTTFSIDGATGAATFAGALSAATGTFAGTLSAGSITSGTLSAASISITGTGGAQLIAGPALGYVALGNVTAFGYVEATANSAAKAAIRGTQAYNTLAVHGEVGSSNSGGNAHGVRGENAYNGATGLVGAANGYDFYADGSGTNYGPFTGAHDALVPLGATLEIGDIVCDVGVAVRKNVSNTICFVAPSTTPGQGAAVGVVATARAASTTAATSRPR